jgi:hypothetical protein
MSRTSGSTPELAQLFIFQLTDVPSVPSTLTHTVILQYKSLSTVPNKLVLIPPSHWRSLDSHQPISRQDFYITMTRMSPVRLRS